MCKCGLVVAICFINEYSAFYELNSLARRFVRYILHVYSQGLLQHGTSLRDPIHALSNDPLTIVCSKRQTTHVSSVFEQLRQSSTPRPSLLENTMFGMKMRALLLCRTHPNNL